MLKKNNLLVSQGPYEWISELGVLCNIYLLLHGTGGDETGNEPHDPAAGITY